MIFRGFEVTSVSYPDPADGWTYGVYHERTPVYGDLTSSDGGSINFTARCFRETEETGYGVFDYIESAELSFRSGRRDYKITAVVSVSGCGPLKLCAAADGVVVLRDLDIAAGAPTEVSFTVRPIRGVCRIRFYTGDFEAHTFTVSAIGREPLPPAPKKRKTTVFLASDSTVQVYDPYYYPQTGWGEVFFNFFRDPEFARISHPENSSYSHSRRFELPDITIDNRSIGGRSCRSFHLEGKLDELFADAAEGDILMIQFGHNDATKARPNRYVSVPEYKEYLRDYVLAARERHITPVLVTPVSRRNCGDDGVFTISFPEQRDAMISLSREEDVPLLDLGLASLELLNSVGAEASKSLFLWAEPGIYEGAYSGGVTDNTHLQRRGALLFASALARLILESDDARLGPVRSALICDINQEKYIKKAEAT